jgi:NSS family neurotransmitter:Na+ symporter
VLLVGLAAWASTQSGATAAYDFYLGFDLSKVRENFFTVLGPAAGQALFTLSLGAGTMVTYASYIGEDQSLPFDGTTIAVLNTFVGVLAGLVVFPLLFSLGIDPAETEPGPGALFVGLADAFSNLPAGTLVATAFFGVVVLAALSSSISMLEIPVSYLVDEHEMDRRPATAVVGTVVVVTGGICAFNPSVFGWVAGPLVDTLLTAGLTAVLVFAGWVVGRDSLAEFRSGAGDIGGVLATPWLVVVGVFLPVFLVFTLLTNFGVDGDVGFWPTVGLAVVLAVGAFLGVRNDRALF